MSDRFRKVYRTLTEGEKAAVEGVKTLAEQFDEFIELELSLLTNAPDKNRNLALARTHLEDAVMRYTKAITG